MREQGICALPRKRFRRTTDSDHDHVIAPNVLARDFVADRPDQRCGDAEVLVVQTRYRNRSQSRHHEHPRTGKGEVTIDRAVVIGGIAVEPRSASDLWEKGFIDLSYDQMLALPTIEL